MNVWESVRVALSGLMANKLRAALTMLGIIIGVAAVIVLVSIGRGLQKLINDEFNAFGTNLIFIFSVTPGEDLGGGPPSTRDALGLSNDDAYALQDIPGVLEVSPALQRGAVVIFDGYDTETNLIAVTPETQEMRDWTVITGRYITQEDLYGEARVAVIGQTVMDDVFKDGAFPIDQTIRINDVPFRVVGILEEKGGTLGQDNDDTVIVPLTTAQNRLFDARRRDGEPEADVIQISVDPEADADLIVTEIEFIMRDRHDIRFRNEDDFQVITQDEFLAAFEQVTSALTAFLGIVAGISLLVGGIGIMNIMLVSVTERTREIGIRKAVGAKQRDILAQFLVEAVTLALIGGIGGILLGAAGAALASAAVPDLTTVIGIDSVLMATIISALIGMFFGIYPAWRAARLHPIEALRFE